MFFEQAVIVPFLVHLTYKTEFLVFPISPARRDSFRTQQHFYSIPNPPNSSSRLSLISFTDLLRRRSPGLPLLSGSVWFSATVLGLHNTSPVLSTLTTHQTAFFRQNDFFCREVKRDTSAEGISVERLVLQGLSLTVSLNALSALTF